MEHSKERLAVAELLQVILGREPFMLHGYWQVEPEEQGDAIYTASNGYRFEAKDSNSELFLKFVEVTAVIDLNALYHPIDLEVDEDDVDEIKEAYDRHKTYQTLDGESLRRKMQKRLEKRMELAADVFGASGRRWKAKAYAAVCEALKHDLPHGSGIDGDWVVEVVPEGSRENIAASNSYHLMDNHGFYCGWISFRVDFRIGPEPEDCSPQANPVWSYRVTVNKHDVDAINDGYVDGAEGEDDEPVFQVDAEELTEYLDQTVSNTLEGSVAATLWESL